jgi:hypothetical protein
MRSTFALLAIALVFACRTKAGGVQIVATNAPSNVHFVRVYLGISNVSSTLDSSTTLTVPAPVATATQGSAVATTTTQNIFVHDPDGSDDTAVYTNGVTFEFEPNGENQILAAIVVGYTGSADDDVPVAAALVQPKPLTNEHEIDVYTANLGDSNATLPFLWNPYDELMRPLSKAACAGITTGSGSAFIVTDPNDEDCDGYLDGSDFECSPFVYHDQAGVSTNETCFYTAAATALHAEECRLGGRQCLDGSGVGSGTACEPTNTCMPNVACLCTSTDIDVSTDALGCVAEQQTATAAGYGCTVGAQMMSNCTIELPPVTTGGMPCKTTGNHGGLAAAGSTKFSTMPVDTGGYSFTLTINAACGATLEIEPDSMGGGGGGGSNGGSAQSVFPNLLVKLVLVNGASLIYPIVLTADPIAACTGDETTACMRAADEPFTDTLQQCVAGWGSATSTGLAGTSPTLDAAMDIMYYIEAPTNVIMQATLVGSVWTTTPVVGVIPQVPPAVALHLTDDDQTLFVTDSAGNVNVFVKQGNVFAASTTTEPFMPGMTQATWYSPNSTQQTDVIYADDKQLWEVIGNGPPFGSGATVLEQGQTPYMSEDSSALWFVSPTNGSDSNYEVFVQQRVDSGSGFSQMISSPELGMSLIPQGPWVEPVPLGSANQQMMFYSSVEMGSSMPTIYSVQRAPLLLP